MNHKVAGTVSKLDNQGKSLAVQVESLNSGDKTLETANTRIDETLEIMNTVLTKKEKRDVKKWFQEIDEKTLLENRQSLVSFLTLIESIGEEMVEREGKVKILEKQLSNDFHPNEKRYNLQRKLNLEKSKIKKTEKKLKELKQMLSGDVYEAEDKGKNNFQSLVSMLRLVETVSRIVIKKEIEVKNVEQHLSGPNENNDEKRKHLQGKLKADKSTLKRAEQKLNDVVQRTSEYKYEAKGASTLKLLELIGLTLIDMDKKVKNLERQLSDKSEANAMYSKNKKVLQDAKSQLKKIVEVLQEVKQKLEREGYEAENNDRVLLESMLRLLEDIGVLAIKEYKKGKYLVEKLLELSETDDPKDGNGEREVLLLKLRTVKSILNKSEVEMKEVEQELQEKIF